ncbi:MAG TPA: phosphatase PAP2 family protein [Bacteroidales bacterium]|nr:phosphatase PAP2 family protein [Bacteroidales bacterium]
MSLQFNRKIITIITLLLVLSSANIYSQNFDIDLLRKINLNRNRNLDNTFRVITNSVRPAQIGVPIILYGLSLTTKDSVMRRNFFYVGASILTTMAVTTILKVSINRPRPFVTYPDIEKETDVGSHSFPSGHTSDAFALATSVSLAYPKWYVIVPLYLWAGSVGYSRMHLGVHYPSDVLAGAVIGAGSAYLCYKGQQWLSKKYKIKVHKNNL